MGTWTRIAAAALAWATAWPVTARDAATASPTAAAEWATAFPTTAASWATSLSFGAPEPIPLSPSAASASNSSQASSPASASDSVEVRLDRLSPKAADEVLWLARCIYSESDRPHEQRLVAWVVRNRVETQYRGRTYRDVVLEARQFSAFNEPTSRRQRILSLTNRSPYGPWQSALRIALDVYEAPSTERPFPRTVRHFYSPISMKNGLPPRWAASGIEVPASTLGIDPFRFRFYNDVDEQLEAAAAEPRLQDRRSDDGDGFLFPVGRSSGRVARPVRPSVRRAPGR